MASIQTYAETGTGTPLRVLSDSSDAGTDPIEGRGARCGAAGRIAASCTLTQQAGSEHVGVLKAAGLLTERRAGARRLYALDHESLEPVRELLAEFWPDALSWLKKAVEAAHPRPPRGSSRPRRSATTSSSRQNTSRRRLTRCSRTSPTPP